MIDYDGKVNILIVDDRPEKVLALEAILSPLGQNIIHAHSGKEALRHLLNDDFAVILLDVNMPGMDGFETAELIRQRRQSQHIPIIFITAFGDEMHMTRGYSLGAVDFIQAPVMPEVLSTKVSVFVDLYKKSEQLKRQAEVVRQRVTQLHKLTGASLAINSALSMDKMLEVVTETARDVIGTSQACTVALIDGEWDSGQWSVSAIDTHEHWKNHSTQQQVSDLFQWICQMNKPVRLSGGELDSHMAGRTNSGLPLRTMIAAPLSSRDGRNMGLVQVGDKLTGEFTADDEAVLVQLSQMASIAIENTMYCAEREANRIKDEFLAMLSHELRTPLNAILGWTQLLRMNKLGPKESEHGLEVIERNVKSQSKLIEDLLDVSRITTGKLRINPRPMHVLSVVQAAIEAIKPLAGSKQITVDAHLAADQDHIEGDPDRLQQIVWNLLTNAVKFTPTRGRVTLSTDNVDNLIRIKVSDTGQGIRPDFLPYVFDRFRQGDASSTRAHGGLGIGLTIVRHIAVLHGGTVTAESAGEGKGATFTVSLPLSQVPTEAVRRPFTPAESSNGDGEPDLTGLRILVVDDEPDAREVVARILTGAGAEVETAPSADAALEAFEKQQPSIIVSDIAMPDKDGYDLIKIIRSRPAAKGRSTPAIALTAFARKEDATRAMSSGFQMHLAKPVEPVELIAAVAQTVANERLLAAH